jgi:hypothetical protein
MKRAVVHVVGAGVSGLAAAWTLAVSGQCEVVLHEAKPHAGGRRRSFYDEALGLDIDTGNFPLLSCWTSALSLIEAAGARGEWREDAELGVAFADLASGERWRIRPNAGRIPWWLFNAKRRGLRLNWDDYWSARRLLWAPAAATVASLAPRSQTAMERLWRPLTLSALNCEPETASARLAGGVVRELVTAGGGGARLMAPVSSFGRAFVEPLVRRLQRDGVSVRFERKLTGLDRGQDRLEGLEFEHDRVDLGPRDALILATPGPFASTLVPGLKAPLGASASLTVHFAAPPPSRGAPMILGVLNGAFHWLFCYRDRISVTIKDAAARIDESRPIVADECWRGVAALTGLSDARPAWRIVPSRRASVPATPGETARRPPCRTPWRNLFLAGGYVRSPLPDSIESAARSGETAARAWLDARG